MKKNVSRAAVILSAKEARTLEKPAKTERARASREKLLAKTRRARADVEKKAKRSAAVLVGRRVVHLSKLPGASSPHAKKKRAKKNPEPVAVACVATETPRAPNPKRRAAKRGKLGRMKNPLGYIVWGSGRSANAAIRSADSCDEEDFDAIAKARGKDWELSGDRWAVRVSGDDVDESDLDRDPSVIGYTELY